MQKISRTKIQGLIGGTKGHYFGATFIKKDGTKRVVNARLGVTKFLKGGANRVVKPDNAYITVFDRHKNSYITMNLATVSNLTVAGQHYEVV